MSTVSVPVPLCLHVVSSYWYFIIIGISNLIVNPTMTIASSSSSSFPHVIPMDDATALVSLRDGDQMRGNGDENRMIHDRMTAASSNNRHTRYHSAVAAAASTATPPLPPTIPPLRVVMENQNKRRKMNHDVEDIHPTGPTVHHQKTYDASSRIDETLLYCQFRTNQMFDRYLLQEAARVKDRVLQWQQQQMKKNQLGHHRHHPFFSGSINRESTTPSSPLSRPSPLVSDVNPAADPIFPYIASSPDHRVIIESVDNKNNSNNKKTSFASKTTTPRNPGQNEPQDSEQERTMIFQQAYRLKRISALLQQYNCIHTQLHKELNQSII
jgi:hypothetical protein